MVVVADMNFVPFLGGGGEGRDGERTTPVGKIGERDL
jgi:hypothetical protein